MDVSTRTRAKDVKSTGVGACSVMCKLRVHGLCLWAYIYVMVVMKLLEVLSVFRQGKIMLCLLCFIF